MSVDGNNGLRLKQLAKLEELEGELLEKLVALHRERASILAGGPTIGQKMRQVETAWQTTWSARYGAAYAFDRKADPAHMKRLLGLFTTAQLLERMHVFLADERPFYLEVKHGFRIFVRDINELAVAQPGLSRGNGRSSGPSDCRHEPRCESDEAHTLKRRQDRERLS